MHSHKPRSVRWGCSNRPHFICEHGLDAPQGCRQCSGSWVNDFNSTSSLERKSQKMCDCNNTVTGCFMQNILFDSNPGVFFLSGASWFPFCPSVERSRRRFFRATVQLCPLAEFAPRESLSFIKPLKWTKTTSLVHSLAGCLFHTLEWPLCSHCTEHTRTLRCKRWTQYSMCFVLHHFSVERQTEQKDRAVVLQTYHEHKKCMLYLVKLFLVKDWRSFFRATCPKVNTFVFVFVFHIMCSVNLNQTKKKKKSMIWTIGAESILKFSRCTW